MATAITPSETAAAAMSILKSTSKSKSIESPVVEAAAAAANEDGPDDAVAVVDTQAAISSETTTAAAAASSKKKKQHHDIDIDIDIAAPKAVAVAVAVGNNNNTTMAEKNDNLDKGENGNGNDNDNGNKGEDNKAPSPNPKRMAVTSVAAATAAAEAVTLMIPTKTATIKTKDKTKSKTTEPTMPSFQQPTSSTRESSNVREQKDDRNNANDEDEDDDDDDDDSNDDGDYKDKDKDKALSLSSKRRRLHDNYEDRNDNENENKEKEIEAAMAKKLKSNNDDDDNNDIIHCYSRPMSSPVQHQRRQEDQLRQHQQGRNPHPSPIFVATGWPQRSPMMMGTPPRNRNVGGGEYHCLAERHDSINVSSSTPSSHSHDHTHRHHHDHDHAHAHQEDDVAHALFTESFDTISACTSAVVVVPQLQNKNYDSILSPRQKTHTPTEDVVVGGVGVGDIVMLSPRKKSRKSCSHNDDTNNNNNNDIDHRRHSRQYNQSSARSSSVETYEDDGNDDHHQHYHHHSPHSLPQRVVHVDASKGHLPYGDDHGCGDISPIKFSPPTGTSPHRNRHHHSRYEGGLSSNNMELHDDQRYHPQYDGNHYHPKTSSSPTNGKDTKVGLAGGIGHQDVPNSPREVSFLNSGSESSDTPVGNNSYSREISSKNSNSNSDNREDEPKREKSTVRPSRKRQAQQEDESPSYSSPSLSKAKTPPRRGTGGGGDDNRRAKGIAARNDQRPLDNKHNNDKGFAEGHYYDRGRYHGHRHPSFSTAPPLPRDLPPPHYANSYYPNYPPVPLRTGGRLPAATGDDSKGDVNSKATRKGSIFRRGDVSAPAGRTVQSSPISSTRPHYPAHLHHQPHHPYGGPPTAAPPPASIPSPWMDHPYSDHQDYPPPRARMPPTNWHMNHHQQQQHPAAQSYYQTGVHSAPTDGHDGLKKGNRGTAAVGPTTKDYYQTRHNPPPLPPNHYNSASMMPVSGYGANDPFNLFRSIRKIFEGCSYLLYPAHMGVKWGGDHQTIHTDPEDLKVARRRVESAICALGGYIKDIQEREKSPNYYRDRFHKRYFVGGHGISWEVEENPPVFVSSDEEDSIVHRNRTNARNNHASRNGTPSRNGMSVLHQEGNQSSSPYDSQPSSSMGSQPSSTGTTQLDHSQKMKYRCKLCGQPKQNHICPYRKSLLRTIGVMVCPAVNAYTSSEPGVLTPSLSEMNNFVPYGRSDDSSDMDTDVSSRDASSAYRLTPGGANKASEHRHHSPNSSSLFTSPHSDDHQSPGETHYLTHQGHQQQQQQQQQRSRQHVANQWQRKPLAEPQPLMMSLALRPEHYRAVTPRTPHRNSSAKKDERDDKEGDSFEYPHVPLTFLGRKRLTDTLFYLSRSIPSVTADVASLLRMARERDEWDLAVAEVLTQVVVCIHCSEGDYELDGLRKYLLKIGISS